MGLDNGLIARKTGVVSIDKQLKEIGLYSYDDGEEIAYWRKCWNVRYAIADAIKGINDNDNTEVTVDDVIAIIKKLKKFNRKTWCTEACDSIWSWSEIKKNHRANIRRLCALARLMKKYPTIEVYFYDSY